MWELGFFDNYAGILPSRQALERAALAGPDAAPQVIVRQALAADGLAWMGEEEERPRSDSEASRRLSEAPL